MSRTGSERQKGEGKGVCAATKKGGAHTYLQGRPRYRNGMEHQNRDKNGQDNGGTATNPEKQRNERRGGAKREEEAGETKQENKSTCTAIAMKATSYLFFLSLYLRFLSLP